MTDPVGSSPERSPYWRSLAELEGSEEFLRHLEAEFPTEADVPVEGVSRRRFLQLMAASAALVGLAGCRWPREEILPFGRRPEDYEPGKVKRYASALGMASMVKPVLISSFDGRPIKVEGNPQHPLSLGAADLFAQAAILELYDPDRSRHPVERENGTARERNWSQFAAYVQEKALEGSGKGFAVLKGESASLVEDAALDRLRRRYPGIQVYRHEPVSLSNEAEGLRQATGRPARLLPELEDARVLVDLDANLLIDHPAALRNTRFFSRGRRPEQKEKNRLYCFETGYSSTGAMADHRFPLAAKEFPALMVELAARLLEKGSGRLQSTEALASLVGRLRPGLLQVELSDHGEILDAVVDDLLDHPGRGLIAVGRRRPAALHALAFLMNAALGNVGSTLKVFDQPFNGDDGDLSTLCRRIDAGEVSGLLILGGNPVYDAPADLEFRKVLERVEHSIHFGLVRDETARRCRWHLPRAHALESWDVLRAVDGSLCAGQPLIAPMFAGLGAAEVLSILADDPPQGGYDQSREVFAQHTGTTVGDPGFDTNWRRFLHDGFVPGPSPVEPSLRVAPSLGKDLAGLIERGAQRLDPEELELVFMPDPRLFDGRFANNAWLQELPDFVTKLTWDNPLLISPALSKERGLRHGDLVEASFGGRRLEAAIYVLPGHARYSVSLALGHGRSAAGRVGDGVGFDSYRLRTTTTLWDGVGLKLFPTGRRYKLACTQDHHAIDTVGADERERRAGYLVREGTVQEYEEHPGFAQHMGPHHPPLESLWKERETTGHKWGMTIDLNSCIGCNACVTACQAENNIPVVGKEQVANGREMHWIRIDRYFKGPEDDPEVVQQPMACVQCELAPCEQVCPVAATMHNEEGLNVMVYNRCVGTRYCLNNCPYKVRRFNFFNYHKNPDPLVEMAYNPEVTIRARGVMEKCTYCVQRIEHARITAKNEGRSIRDGEITTACQQTCPAEAIVFGDLNDPKSRVSALRDDPRSYAALADLNLKPRTTYLARLRNPNPRLEHLEGAALAASVADGPGESGSGHSEGAAGAANHH